MNTNDLTPAQKNLLSVCGGAEAHRLLHGLTHTLHMSMQGFVLADGPPDGNLPTPVALESWCNTVEVMMTLQNVVAEQPAERV